MNRVEVYTDKAGEFRYRVVASENGKVISTGEGYANRVDLHANVHRTVARPYRLVDMTWADGRVTDETFSADAIELYDETVRPSPEMVGRALVVLAAAAGEKLDMNTRIKSMKFSHQQLTIVTYARDKDGKLMVGPENEPIEVRDVRELRYVLPK